MKFNKSLVKIMIKYCFITNFVNYMTTVIFEFVFNSLVRHFLGNGTMYYIVMFTVVAPIVLIVSLSGIGFLMKKDITTFYAHNNCLNWKKEAVFVLIPGELIRAFLCMTKLGAVSTVLGKLSVLTTAIYQTVYLSLTGRLEEILNNSTYVFYAKDYFAFMTCHLMYMFFYFPFVVYIYLRCCRRGTMERQDLDLACR